MLRRPPHPLAALSLTPNQRRLRVGLMALGCALCACGSTSGQNSQAPIAPPATRHASADPPWLPEDAHAGVKHQALCDLLKQEWAGSLAHDPLWASDLGVHALDDRLPHRSRSSVAAWQQAQRQYLARGEAIPDAELTPEEQLTKRLFIGQQRSRLGSFACKSELWSIDARDNPLVELNRIPEVTRLDSLSGGHALLARYRAVPGFVDREIQQKRIGAEQGLIASRSTLERVIRQYRTELAKPDAEWPLYKAAVALPPSWPAAQREALQRELLTEVCERIRPAYRRYLSLLERDLLPQARDAQHEGLGALPVGPQCYAAAIRRHTTLDQSAEALHQLGLDQLKQIHAEIVQVGARVFAEPGDTAGDLPSIQRRLREDQALFFSNQAEIKQAATTALSRAQAELPKLFHRLPKAACVVRGIPDYEAAFSPIAYYRPPEPGGGKPGEYFVNLLNPGTRPRYEAEVLAFHESLPGHHLQIAIAQELPELPAFRKHAYNTAYVEGWGLYVERLADEAGLYSGDLSRLGMLSFDTWRASRLVVDTGLHARGWTRAQAEQFMLENTMLTPANIENEVDRYISWPGQALAYKVGQLRFLALRKQAEQALGAGFELAAFHDLLLSAGPLPLGELSARVAQWIERQRPGAG